MPAQLNDGPSLGLIPSGHKRRFAKSTSLDISVLVSLELLTMSQLQRSACCCRCWVADGPSRAAFDCFQ